MSLKAINPANGKLIKSYPEHSSKEIEKKIEKCHAAFLKWRKTPVEERQKLLKKAGDLLRENVEKYARLMALEMGKPVRDGRFEVLKCAGGCDYMSENAATLLKPEIVTTDVTKSFVTFEPLGVLLAIMPWNFPFWQVFRCAIVTLMAGNTILLKHASNVPGCATAIADLFRKAGFPDGVVELVLAGSKHVEKMIEHPKVAAVTLTGSTPAGRAVARKAGECLKKVVLELGGSDPYIILEDANLEAAVPVCVSQRLMNSGQSCIAAKRFIVVKKLKKRFEELFVEQISRLKVGDPLEEDTVIGPMARFDLRDELHKQVEKSIKMGAKLLLGGKIPSGKDPLSKGAFYPATVLTDVKKGMPAYDEELFGPVAAIIEAKNEKDAIRIANDSNFGLGAAVFTEDISRGENIAAHELEAGVCAVNTIVKSDPRLPFGGIKASGFGRELAKYGMYEFTNIKTVLIK